ncbi:MAG TPA: c-type cytochrome [Thermoanaerobaculia bacterium]
MKAGMLMTLLALTAVTAACSRDRAETATTETAITSVSEVADQATATNVPAERIEDERLTATVAIGESPSSVTIPAMTGGDGEAIFSARCSGCHGADGKRATSGVTLASDETRNKSIAELTKLTREGSGSISATAHRRANLSEAEVHAVVAHIRTLQ